jgi:hypothetical protein
MALTKVKLISDGVIVQGNLHSSHGITTAHIAEGTSSDSGLYYTNARVDSRIAAASTSDLSEGTNLYYTDARADARVALIVDSSPATLNTLNELAAALGDDPNFATTTANSIGTKLPLAGGNLTGNLGIADNKYITFGTYCKIGEDIDNLDALTIEGHHTESMYFTNSENNIERLVLTGTGSATFAGNVTAVRGFFNSGATNVVATFTSTDGTATLQCADPTGNVEFGASGNNFVVQPAGGVAQLTVGSSTSTFAGNIRTGTSTLTANTNFDNLVIEGSAHTGITIFSGTSSDGGIYFGDSGANNLGQIKYLHSSNAMTFATNDGSPSLTLDSSQNASFSGDVSQSSASKSLKYWRRLWTDANNDWGLNNNAGSAVISVSGMGTPSTSLTTFAGQVKTNLGTAISYAAGDETVAAHEHEEIQVDSDNQYKRMGAITVSKYGTISVKWESYIVSGAYYWSWAIARNNGTTVSAVTPSNILKSGGFSTAHPNGLASGVTSSVHAMRQYDVDIADVIPGDQIELWMRSSTHGGAQVTGVGQQLRAKKIRISSTTPTVESNAYFHGTTTLTDVAGDERYGGESWSKYLTFDAADSGGGGMVWSKQSNSWNRGILSNHGDLQIVRSSEDNNSGTIVKDLIISNTGNSTFAGSIGIGMAPSTDAKLEILNGNIRVRGSSANSIMLSTTAGATRAALGNYGNEGDLSLWRSNNAKYIYLSSYYDSYINPDGGSLFIGGTANLGYNSHNVVKNGSQSYALIVRNSNTTTTNNSSIQLNVAATGSNGYFMICRQGDPNSGTNRLWINTNGNVQNVNNSYGAISDERKKENIVDATPKLDKLMGVKVRNFNLIGEETKQIGVVAQELEEVFPGMISESKYPDSKDETLYKSVKYSVFVPMLIKAIQELKSDNDSLKARIETLENN